MTRTVEKYMQLYYRATVDTQLLILKMILVLNCGALVSILVALSRSDIDGFGQAVMGTAYYFWWGLFTAIVSIFTFTPVASDIDEFKEHLERHTIPLTISALAALISIIIFMFGTWSTISSLDAYFGTSSLTIPSNS